MSAILSYTPFRCNYSLIYLILRFDYSDRTLRFKTSTPQTEFANAKVISSIVLALYTISQDASQNSDTIKLVDSINSFGSTVIKGAYCVYEPSCQFRLFNPSIAKRPGVVIEVAWSRPWKVLEKKMSDLLEVGGGMTRAVIGVELVESAPGHMKVFLSFWRLGAPYEVVWDRAEIGADDERALCLTLSDFISRDTCANYFPRAELETEILIPLGKIYQSAQWGFELWQEEKQQDEI